MCASWSTVNVFPDYRILVCFCSSQTMPSRILGASLFPWKWAQCENSAALREECKCTLCFKQTQKAKFWTYQTGKLGGDYSHDKSIHHRMLLGHKLLYYIQNKLYYKASFSQSRVHGPLSKGSEWLIGGHKVLPLITCQANLSFPYARGIRSVVHF